MVGKSTNFKFGMLLYLLCGAPHFASQSSPALHRMLWGANAPGVLTFTTEPTSSVVITADFSYYFPVRMSEDSVSFTLFLSQYYKAKKFSFISVKN